MSVVHVLYLIGGTIVLVAVMITVMIRVIRNERRYMERRRQQWIDAGSKPEDKPFFDLGPPALGG